MDPDTDKPVRPRPAEVRAITEHHAEHMISMLEGLRDLERSLRDSQCSDRARLYHEKDKLTGAFNPHVRCTRKISDRRRQPDLKRMYVTRRK